jgi:uncharacterized protein (TIGR02391 family)
MEISKAVALLERALDVIPRLKRLSCRNQELPLWDERVRGILAEAFGPQSDEYARYDGILVLKRVEAAEEMQQAYVDHVAQREAALMSIVQRHKPLAKLAVPARATGHARTLAVTGEGTEVANRIFDDMQFHPKVIEASRSLFQTGHYSQAIFEAFKAVNNLVKERSRCTGLDGRSLMTEAFNEANPVIRLNQLKSQSDRDEQEGFRFLFMGAVVGIRNPTAHENINQRDPYRALEYLALASLLMKRVDEGAVKRSRKKREVSPKAK